MTRIRSLYPALSKGRQYLRPTLFLLFLFDYYGDGELFAFSRIRAGDEAIICIKPQGNQSRGANLIVDAKLNPKSSRMQVIYNSAQAEKRNYIDSHAVGRWAVVKRHDYHSSIISL